MVKEEKKEITFTAFNLFIFFVAVYILTSSGYNYYYSDASILRIEVVKSIVERSDLSVTEGTGIVGADGREYSWLGIGSALLAVPFYSAGKFMGIPPEIAVSLVNQIAGSATAVLIFLFSISLGYTKRASLLVAIFYGLGTIAWPYAKHPFNRPLVTFFILFSIYSMYLYITDKKIIRLLLSAFSLGLAFITRSTTILVIPPLFIMMTFFYRKNSNMKTSVSLIARDIILFSLFFMPFICTNLWYNYFRFGSIFESGYSQVALRTGIDMFSGTSFLTGIKGLLISPGKGFFYYSPIAMFFFFSIKPFLKKHSGVALCFIGLILSYFLLISKYVHWHGDWAWGPRHIFVITPFLMIPLAELLDSGSWQKKRILRVAVFSIFTVSLIIQLAAVSVTYKKYFYHLMSIENVDFTIIEANGLQRPIIEPPDHVYFDWQRWPILAQFGFIYEIAGKISDHKYSEPQWSASISKRPEEKTYMNVFDFWWAHIYLLGGSKSGLFMVLTLIPLALYSGTRLMKILMSQVIVLK